MAKCELSLTEATVPMVFIKLEDFDMVIIAGRHIPLKLLQRNIQRYRMRLDKLDEEAVNVTTSIRNNVLYVWEEKRQDAIKASVTTGV